MLKERISKLQEWILKRIEEKTTISQRGLKRYFNKELRDPLMNKERVTLFKSIKNMISKGLIKEGEFKSYILTEKGFNSLKVNVPGSDITNFKDYLSRLESSDKEFKAHQKDTRTLLDGRKRSKRA
ncbi:MAG: hypothetical protein IID03_09225 [Candidatus Dadabacteria bacterium]|nr:hypothetical protein [Candidatus Dadabacteria bacterium]